MLKFTNFLLSFFSKGSSSAPDDGARLFMQTAFNDMLDHNRQHAANWQYGKETGWTADIDAGVIVFKFVGERTATCHFQSVGIYDETSGSFTWAWAQKKLSKNQQVHAKQARNWGRFHRHPLFLSGTVKCSMTDAWNLAAVTRSVAEAKSIYRGRVGNKYLFMTTDDLQIDASTVHTDWASGRRKPSW